MIENHGLLISRYDMIWCDVMWCDVICFDMSTIIVFLCIWGWSSNKICLAQTSLAIPGVYIRSCMLGSDQTCWPPNQTLSSHWDTTGQTTLEPHWLGYHPVVLQWQSSGNLHKWNTLEDQWSRKYTGMPLEANWLMLAKTQWCPSGNPVLICIIGTHWNATGRPLETY